MRRKSGAKKEKPGKKKKTVDYLSIYLYGGANLTHHHFCRKGTERREERRRKESAAFSPVNVRSRHVKRIYWIAVGMGIVLSSKECNTPPRSLEINSRQRTSGPTNKIAILNGLNEATVTRGCRSPRASRGANQSHRNQENVFRYDKKRCIFILHIQLTQNK